MKVFIGLCLFAVFCAVQVSAYNPLDQLRQQLNLAKNKVDGIQRDLKRSRSLLSMNTKNQLSNDKIRSMSTINDVVNSALKDIRAKVDAAKAEGKDVENCYTTAKNDLGSNSRALYQELNQCETKGEQLLQVQLDILSAAEAVGDKYIAELNSVFPNCYSSNMNQMQTCIAIKLGTINSAIRSYDNEAQSLQRTTQSGANKAYLAANSCNLDVKSKGFSMGTNVRIAASRCIDK